MDALPREEEHNKKQWGGKSSEKNDYSTRGGERRSPTRKLAPFYI